MAEPQRTATGPGPRFEFVTSSEFATGDFTPEWLIEHVLVKDQPGGIAGPSKTLKTGLALDMAISLASATKFLGEFWTPKRRRVAVVSGESGAATLQETAKRICAARDLQLAHLGDYLQWCFSLPTLSDLEGMADFTEQLVGIGAEVVILDPLYLCLGDVDARSVFAMGGALRAVGEMLLKAGSTPLFVHHANGQLHTGEAMELRHMSHTGLEQYLRQFVLLNRQSAYCGDGNHDLFVNIGGSAGHGRLVAVRIEEGVIDAKFGGRKWGVTVQKVSEAKEDQRAVRDRAKVEAAKRKAREHETKVLEVIDREEERGHGGATKTVLKEDAELNTKQLNEVIASLIEKFLIVKTVVTKSKGNSAKHEGPGWKRLREPKQGHIPGM